jgi:hypothetical protein
MYVACARPAGCSTRRRDARKWRWSREACPSRCGGRHRSPWRTPSWCEQTAARTGSRRPNGVSAGGTSCTHSQIATQHDILLRRGGVVVARRV